MGSDGRAVRVRYGMQWVCEFECAEGTVAGVSCWLAEKVSSEQKNTALHIPLYVEVEILLLNNTQDRKSRVLRSRITPGAVRLYKYRITASK